MENPESPKRAFLKGTNFVSAIGGITFMAVHPRSKGSQGSPSLRLRRALGFVLLAATFFGVFRLASLVDRKTSFTVGGLETDPRFLDFGEVWEDAEFQWKLPIRNVTTQEIEILDFAPACTCISFQPHSFSLAPGERKELMLTLDLTRRRRQTRDRGEFDSLILPKIKGTLARTEGWTLHGKVRELLKCIPPVVTFGELIRGQPATETLIKIESAIPLRSLQLKDKENNACVYVVQKGSRNFELTVIPPDTVPSGLFRLEVPLQPIGEAGQSLPTKKLIIIGIMHEDVEPVPSPLVFGALSIAQTAKETIVLKSLTGKPFKVEKWEPLSKGLRIEPVKVGIENEPVFVVSQKCTTAGDQWTEAIFQVRIGNQPSREIHLKIFYHGLEKAQKRTLGSVFGPKRLDAIFPAYRRENLFPASVRVEALCKTSSGVFCTGG